MGQNGILWVLDVGITNTLKEKPQRECEAKILGINYVNGRVSNITILVGMSSILYNTITYFYICQTIEYLRHNRDQAYNISTCF